MPFLWKVTNDSSPTEREKWGKQLYNCRWFFFISVLTKCFLHGLKHSHWNFLEGRFPVESNWFKLNSFDFSFMSSILEGNTLDLVFFWDQVHLSSTVKKLWAEKYPSENKIFFILSTAWRNVRRCAPAWPSWWMVPSSVWAASNIWRTGEGPHILPDAF